MSIQVPITAIPVRRVHPDEPTWQMAAALLLSLAVDIHSRSERKPGTDLSSPTADDFLLPQSKWVDGKLVQLPYYHFTIRFAVSAHFSGSIAVDADYDTSTYPPMSHTSHQPEDLTSTPTAGLPLERTTQSPASCMESASSV